MKVILNCEKISHIVESLASQIASHISAGQNIAVIGVRSRGEVLAQRLALLLSEKTGKKLPSGTLDITLYRDDFNVSPSPSQPKVRTTEIPFDISDKIIILVDDVLYTGRSARAAMDALIDLGRPKAIRLAVLVDRIGRELPIQADYKGHRIDIQPEKVVHVQLRETDDHEQVVIE